VRRVPRERQERRAEEDAAAEVAGPSLHVDLARAVPKRARAQPKLGDLPSDIMYRPGRVGISRNAPNVAAAPVVIVDHSCVAIARVAAAEPRPVNAVAAPTEPGTTDAVVGKEVERFAYDENREYEPNVSREPPCVAVRRPHQNDDVAHVCRATRWKVAQRNRSEAILHVETRREVICGHGQEGTACERRRVAQRRRIDGLVEGCTIECPLLPTQSTPRWRQRHQLAGERRDARILAPVRGELAPRALRPSSNQPRWREMYCCIVCCECIALSIFGKDINSYMLYVSHPL
jgi:hypothetical protein